ncbi:MAG: hypothetical protein IKX63_04170 [Muribaculaceae bacterium]|nr:hypothetical protein [Muribaculaceae bacterium]
MKKYIVLSVIAVAALQAWACGGWIRPNYYMFSVFNRELMENPFAQETKQYWVNYTGDESAAYSCDMLDNIKPEEFDDSDNIIVETARKRGDTETLNYLRLLVTYLNNDNSDVHSWNYPTKEELAQRKVEVQNVLAKALAYKGTKYKSQYALLVMRCNMTAENHKANISYWEKTASKLKENVYKRWMKDIYAGALYNTGNKDKACEIFTELGDMTSIKYCVRKKRNLKGIKEEYAANPNSPTLIFLVQDFVNNTQETLDNGSDPEMMRYVEATGIYQNEMNDFVNFAGKVLSEKKTKSPAMWEAARGFVNYMAGNQEAALEQLANAQTLDGTQRMKDNARACLMLASIKSAQPNEKFFNYMLGEYKWLEQKAGYDNDHMAADPHYNDVFERVTYDALVPKYYSWNMPNQAIALLGMASHYNQYTSEYRCQLDTLSSSEFEGYKYYLGNGVSNDFEKWVASFSNIDNIKFNDMMGTKLVREGEFQAAINFLEKVPLSYISEQGISYYMARKDYNKEIWMKRQPLSFWNEELTPVTANAKLQYCRDMIALDDKIANSSGDERNELLYKKANLLYQASHKGDCWYLAHYQNGVCSEKVRGEYDFIGTARRLLVSAEHDAESIDLKQKCIFAQTFIVGEIFGNCVAREYDWNSNKSYYSIDNEQYPHIRAMERLINFASKEGNIDADYISKCDIIKAFINKYN